MVGTRGCWPSGMVLAALLLAGCTPATTGNGETEVVPPGCNPLSFGGDCLLPYPSDVFLVDDATMPSGKRLVLEEPARFKQMDGYGVDFTRLHKSDGFSHMPSIVAVFPVLLSQDNLLNYTKDYAQTANGVGPTVLVDAATGERILHIAELDPLTQEPGKQTIIIRPLVRLKNRTRYVVGLRDLRDVAGAAVAPPEGFRRVRDNSPMGSPKLAALAQRYDAQVFPVLETAGFARASLQLAWDFTTQSMENVSGDMLTARAAVVAALDQTPPAIRVTDVRENENANTWRRVEGLMDVPSIMASEEFGSLLNRDANGRVIIAGTTQVAFTVLIPVSVRDDAAARPVRVMQYGHGFFGSRSEVLGGFVTPYMNEHKMVVVAVDWWGMSVPDVTVVVDDLLNNMDQTMRFTDRVHQGMMNQIALEYVVKHTLGSLPQLQIGGVPVFNPDELYYYGNSQGHILGGVFFSLSRFIDRGVLGVGGMGFFSLIAPRARPFITYLELIRMTVTDPLEQQKLLAVGQSGFDRVDPGTYAVITRSNTVQPGPTQRRILMQTGLGDAQVPSIAAESHARTLALPLMVPSVKEFPGLQDVTGPVDDSAYVQFNFNLPDNPLPGTFPVFPEDENLVHEAVRRSIPGKAQADGFLRPNGVITHTCNGACDPD